MWKNIVIAAQKIASLSCIGVDGEELKSLTSFVSITHKLVKDKKER